MGIFELSIPQTKSRGLGRRLVHICFSSKKKLGFLPPGELMYSVISLLGSSFARYKSWATKTLATSSLTSVPSSKMRSFNNRLTTSSCPDCPSTVGRGGGRGGLGAGFGGSLGCGYVWKKTQNPRGNDST